MTKFSDLNLDPRVLTAIEDAGYETPTPIQEGAIPPALTGQDVLGIAQTGTGKTASFTLPMITLLSKGRARARMPRSLVLAPTRELAAQVAENFDVYAKHTKLTKALLIGGVSFGEQDKLIDRGVDVLIATPGRLLDHFERGKLLLTGVQIMVVDEADRMLDMGFIPDIERIFQLTPFTRQTLFFSATMPSEIERLTNTFLSNPARVEVARQASTSETITQGVVSFKPTRKDRAFSEKSAMLRAMITREGDGLRNAIIFCNRKLDVDAVAKSLKKNGLNAEPIHGDLDQSHRTRTLDGFRDGSIAFLIASDVAARGLDIPNVSHVFNFDVPNHAEDYVHRIGRTGRAGRTGVALMLATPSDDKQVAAIEEMIGQPVPKIDAPEVPKARSRTRSRTADEDAVPAADAAPAESAATETASDSPKEETPKPRSRSRSRKPAAAPAVEADAPAAPSAEPEVAAPEPERPQAERSQDEAPKPSRGRSQRKSSSRRGGSNDKSGDDVVGMGDHVPEFITRSFLARSPS
ncbi:DEAD/DEAH box helicase [Roseicyclus sp. F158]|uniref:DEAD/DEAH box helicase n=1 Tax=Tropicimonas omnivorans TaxID=3075590 RepID=A0ABU3DKQ8_9RHOB|nr:DEAD/DEAH box helicase [Roseicyclus sp. F158]MDT0683697.1 DEAD/DEAH box helicase [Roseicyclus sp. F158]